MRTETDTAAHPQLLSFVVAGGVYAVPILQVREILQFDGATPVPGAPRGVRGVVNLRGGVVPVVDLGVKLGRAEIERTRTTCVLVVEARLEDRPLLVGLLADAVREVLELPQAQIDPPPALGPGARIDYIVGVGKVGSGLVLLVDVDRLLSAEEKAAGAGEREPATAAPAA